MARVDLRVGQESLMPQTRRLRLLMLCDYHQGSAGTIIEHIEGLKRYSRHDMEIVSCLGQLPSKLDLARFDGLIVHYSLVACHDSFIAPATRNKIRNFQGLKIAFVQDDYRFISATCAALRHMKIHALFGLAPTEVIDKVYSPQALPGVRRETVLAGYVPEELARRGVPPYEARKVDIGYRARKLPAWIGSHAQEKWRIAEGILADAPRFGLSCDISCREADRLYGEAWIDFITNCKAVLGTESGSSVCDFTGGIQKAVEAHEARNPTASFEEMRELYFKDVDGQVMMNIISPRCFEAASLRTLMILYEGKYSGRLEPWRHYVPLRKDHGNMDEVVAVLRDPARARGIIDRAYREVALNPANSFRAMVGFVDDVIDETFRPAMAARKAPHSGAELERIRAELKKAQQSRARRQAWLIWIIRAVDACLAPLPKPLAARIRGSLRAFYHFVFSPATGGFHLVSLLVKILDVCLAFLPRQAALPIRNCLRATYRFFVDRQRHRSPSND